jgi:hypothetical protein
MSDLTAIGKRKLERLLGMGSVYFLNFSNRTFEEFADPLSAEPGRSARAPRDGNVGGLSARDDRRYSFLSCGSLQWPASLAFALRALRASLVRGGGL